jgi:predicted lipoprotein with Yx(FWY)xxD motif
MKTIRILMLVLGVILLLAACRPQPTQATQPASPPAPTQTPAPTQPSAPTRAPTSSGGDDYGYGSYGAPSSTEAPSAGGVLIKVAQKEGLGTFLVDSQGRALYLFLPDTPTHSACTGGCANNWPPLLTSGAAQAGEGVDASKLGTLVRDDGAVQVTYNGHPLYYFAGDRQAGDTNGQGVGGKWYLVTPAGEPLR